MTELNLLDVNSNEPLILIMFFFNYLNAMRVQGISGR